MSQSIDIQISNLDNIKNSALHTELKKSNNNQYEYKKKREIDVDSLRKYKDYKVQIRVVNRAQNRWGHEIVTLCVKYKEQNQDENQSFDYFGDEVPLGNEEKSKGKKGSKKSEEIIEEQNSYNDSKENLNHSITEEEYDRRSIEEFKSINYYGENQSRFKWFKHYIVVGALICVCCKLGNYFPYRNSCEFLRKAAFLVNIELQLENQLQHLMYVNKRLEVIANKIED